MKRNKQIDIINLRTAVVLGSELVLDVIDKKVVQKVKVNLPKFPKLKYRK